MRKLIFIVLIAIGAAATAQDIVPDYDSLDNYVGSESILILDNPVYGGTWVRDDGISTTTINYGVARVGVTPRKWKRIHSIGEEEVNWWVEDGAGGVDGTVNVTDHLQDAIDYHEAEKIKAVNFSGIYLSDSLNFSTPGQGNYFFNGNGSQILLDSGNTTLVHFGQGGNNAGTTFRDFWLVGTDTGVADYQAGKNRLLTTTAHRNLKVIGCSFSKFTGQAIYIESVSGDLFKQGMKIENCTFRDQTFDDSTTDQTAIYLSEDAEYCRISGNIATEVVQFIKSVDGANNQVLFNQIGETRGPLQSGGLDRTRAILFLTASPNSTNSGKYMIFGNTINHVGGGQPPIHINGANANNDDNTYIITSNQFLANGYFPAIIVDTINNVLINNNHIRTANVAQATAFIELNGVDNGIVTNNNCQDGRYVVKLSGGSDGLIYDDNNQGSTLLTNGYIETVSGSIREDVSETRFMAVGGETTVTAGSTLPTNVSELFVSINGVVQDPTSYTVNHNLKRIQGLTALTAGDVVLIRYLPFRGQKK